MDLVSIIVPIYNVDKYLNKCLESLVNQTYKNIEIILVNDGSTDNSQKIIEQYVSKYPNLIKSYKKENGGLSDARNYGFKKAKGKYLAFIDSDDYVTENYVEKLYKSIKENSSDLAICNYYNVKENKYIVSKNYITQSPCSIFDDKLQLFNACAVWNKMFSKNTLCKNNFLFDKGVIYEDLRFILKCYTKIKKISYVEDPLYYYIIRNGSIMNSINIKKNEDILKGFDNVIKYYQKEDIYDEFKEEIEFLAIKNIIIAALVRVIRISSYKEIKLNINPYLKFMMLHFPNYNKNKYIKLLSKNHKLILFLINKRRYKVLKLLIKIHG